MQIGIRQSLYFFMIDLIEIKKPLALCSGFFGIWCPYGDSNPGYRRERAMSHIVFIFVKFCNFIPELVTLLKHHVNFLELDARIFALCEYPNDRAKLTHDREERLVSPKN